jgi:hypothetical protein
MRWGAADGLEGLDPLLLQGQQPRVAPASGLACTLPSNSAPYPCPCAPTHPRPPPQICAKLGLCPPARRPSASRRLLVSAGSAAAHALRDALFGPAAPSGAAGEWGAAAARLRARYGAASANAAGPRLRAAGKADAGAARLAAALAARLGAEGAASNGAGDSMPCQLCSAAVEYAQQALHSNKTVEEIEEVML